MISTEPTIGQVVEIPTTRIAPDPLQPRKQFDPEYIAGLGQSIKAEGLLQPITIRPDPAKPGHYLIITGECRWRAHCHAGLEFVKCAVTTKHENEAKRFRTQVLENMARAKMTLKDEAFAAKRMQDLGDDDKTAATAIGYSISRLRNIRKMTMLSDTLWHFIEAGTLNAMIAEFTMGAVKDEAIEPLLMRCNGKTRSQAAAIVDGWIDEQRQEDFALAIEQAGVAGKKASMVNDLAIQLIRINSALLELSPKMQLQLARKVGKEVSELVPKTKECARSAVFVAKVMNQVTTALR